MRYNRIKLIISAVICGFAFAGCGSGGNGGGAGSSTNNLKKNEFLGSLPSIYANYQASEKADEEKMEKLAAKGDMNKILKEVEKLEKNEKEKKAKFKEDLSAEIAKIIGKEIPVSFCKELQNSGGLFYEIAPLKLIESSGDPAVVISVSAKNSFEVPRMGGYDYTVYFKIIASDGSTIEKSVLLPVQFSNKAQSFTAGQLLLEQKYSLYAGKNPEKWVNFAGIMFITKTEYEND